MVGVETYENVNQTVCIILGDIVLYSFAAEIVLKIFSEGL